MVSYNYLEMFCYAIYTTLSDWIKFKLEIILNKYHIFAYADCVSIIVKYIMLVKYIICN